jgi:hypothetical protein
MLQSSERATILREAQRTIPLPARLLLVAFSKEISMKTAVFVGLVLMVVSSLVNARATADDEVFSGPQVGEKLTGFKLRGVIGDLEGKEIDLISEANGKPVVLVFMHKLTRPSVAVTRAVLDYSSKFRKEEMVSGLIFLSDDATATEAQIKRAAHALPKVPVGISTDGGEGPGAYGLNRKVTLTVLVGKAGKITANFALVQPSVEADARKIGRQIALAAGKDESPTLAQMGVKQQYRGKNPRMEQDPNIRGLLAPLIQKTATAEEVKQAADKVEAYVAKNPKTRKQIGDIARRIITAGVLERYGTPPAQEYLRKWSKTFDPPAEKDTNATAPESRPN